MDLNINKKTVNRLINLLEKHYELSDQEKRFINRLSENEDEKGILTLIAYSIKDCAGSDVLIIKCPNKILFVKHLKEATGISLKEAKDVADKIISVDEQLKMISHLFKIDEIINGFRMTKEVLDCICHRMNAGGEEIFKYHILTENDKKLLEDCGVSLQKD